MVVAAILAAGRGTRMNSEIPKVLHSLGGKSLLEHVIDSLKPLSPSRYMVIVGHQAQMIRSAMQFRPELEFVEQTEQLGTGHAIKQLSPYLQDYQGDVLVLNGDVPLISSNSILKLLKTHQQNHNAATILTARLNNPKGYGRVFCSSNNLVEQIVEDRDCNAIQRQNSLVNAGVYCFRWRKLAKMLPDLQLNHAQHEYYITDAVTQVVPSMSVEIEDYQEILGVNNRIQLASAYKVLQNRIREKWMMAGVTLIDPSSITIDETVELHVGSIIEPQTHLRGNTIIESGCRIGPGSLIENSQIGKNVTVQYSVITDSSVSDCTRIGPYAHLRSCVNVGKNCRVGNFVELKNTQLGNYSNVAHLSYLGDTVAGDQINIGAGTITANYDGVNKHKTIIGNRIKTGSNSVLVAPVRLGDDVYVAAGSTVTEDVPNDSLVIARARQIIKPGWRMKNE
ncbi:N-acetylglucosamine-1-phosphate uridyltransferase [Richelia intracellularis HM01]|uniref:bifunctional UDP-N-acetylglucosamine diphosphorylase/glucosamine-1-phosphate N-acetyltransferase GlmU n=1 Tax=Richelia intracellularis TaxID=1164990 RepID=UPI0002B5E508|nr:bifunctional UDP-N-acetylglucosamine diphosphorylase/glucosamine-1-phosphate N-acetyltransferase GlmU [Richelia intracellularis]CCH65122.1 N-acetylglucosamine-1-phosphate uridyltransferase [Richelia intracellularis HM01]